jgi:glutamine synthetase
MWSGAYVCYGPDNREAAVRICSPVGAGGSVNLELKPSDSTGNPYLALGGFIQAGLDGIRRELDPGEPLLADPETLSSSERSLLSVDRLPSSLPRALDALEADSVLMSALGPLRATAYLAVKRSEAEHFRQQDAYDERYQHWMRF